MVEWSYGAETLKQRRRARALRRDRRRARALALRALKRHAGNREAAIAELRARWMERQLSSESFLHHTRAEDMLRGGLTAAPVKPARKDEQP